MLNQEVDRAYVRRALEDRILMAARASVGCVVNGAHVDGFLVVDAADWDIVAVCQTLIDAIATAYAAPPEKRYIAWCCDFDLPLPEDPDNLRVWQARGAPISEARINAAVEEWRFWAPHVGRRLDEAWTWIEGAPQDPSATP